jgi:hypothetical protein
MTPTFLFIVAVRTPRLRSLQLQKYYHMRNFPGVPGDMSDFWVALKLAWLNNLHLEKQHPIYT